MKFTCCPVCETVFRVSAEQLEARQGKVRCGQCAQVFDAYENLAEDPQAFQTEPEPSAPVVATPPPPSVAPDQPTTPPPPAPTAHQPELDLGPVFADKAPPRPAPVALPEDWDLPEDVLLKAEPKDRLSGEPRIEPALLGDVGLRPLPARPPAGTDEHKKLGRLAPWLWGGGACLLTLAVLAQAAWWFRSTLVQAVPALRPHYVELASRLGQTMPLPRKADQIAIEGSELRPSPQGKGLLQLAATLRNRAAFAQEWPLLEVTLTDTDDKPLVRRVFNPKEYLGGKADLLANISAGIPANTDLPLSLTLDPTSLNPSGYRVYIFYP